MANSTDDFFYSLLLSQTGESMWSALSDYDQNELYQALAAEEKALRKDNKLAEGCAQLLGAEIGIPSSLHGMMGDLRNELAQSLSQLSQRQLQLSQEGISSEQVVVKLRQECRNLINGRYEEIPTFITLHFPYTASNEYHHYASFLSNPQLWE